MLPKQITFINDNHELLNEVVREFCDPIISTLGPGGCTVIISNEDEILPHVTKDGVTVAESIFFKDNRKQAIASLIKESARKTANAVGDGTTTSIVLAKAMITAGLEKLKTVKSKKDFFEGFDIAVEKVIDYITESSVTISKNSELLESVVKISADGDEKVCKIIMSAVKAAGKDGLVNIELSENLTTSVDVKGGASLESNTIIPNRKRWEAEGNICLVLINESVKYMHEIKSLLESCRITKDPTIIIAKEFSEEIINNVDANNHRNILNVALVEAEGFAKVSRMEILEDLSAIFNVPICSIDGSTGLLLSKYVPLPSTELSRAIITPSETVLFRSDDILSPEAEDRYNVLKKEYSELTMNGDQLVVMDQGGFKHLQRRLAKYNVVATIKVGASTKAEAVEIKDRIDDALSAITAAVNGGIVPGGGITLYRAGTILSDDIVNLGLNEDTLEGYLFLANCCLAPLLTLITNTGACLYKDDIDTLLSTNMVYDFRTYEVVNYIDGGIVDPALVPISALINASSVAKTILKSNSIITEWQDLQAES